MLHLRPFDTFASSPWQRLPVHLYLSISLIRIPLCYETTYHFVGDKTLEFEQRCTSYHFWFEFKSIHRVVHQWYIIFFFTLTIRRMCIVRSNIWLQNSSKKYVYSYPGKFADLNICLKFGKLILCINIYECFDGFMIINMYGYIC